MINLGILSLDHPHSRGNHIPALVHIKDHMRVAAIYHDDADFAKPWVDMLQCRYYADRDALLADPDIQVVLITSKNNRHADDCVAAARAGKDILCDKPIATSARDAERIREAVEQAGVRFFTTFPVRFNSSIQKAKQLIDAGELGEIKAIMATNHGCMYEPGAPDWVKKNALNGGGCIVDHTVHVADIIRWLTGSEFSTVTAQASKRLHDDIEGEDIGVLQGRMENGTVYQIDTSWTRLGTHPMWGDVTFRIVGSKCSMSMDIYNNQRIDVFMQEACNCHFVHNIVLEHGKIFLDYCDCAENAAHQVSAGVVDGVRSVELVYAAYESIAQGKTIALR